MGFIRRSTWSGAAQGEAIKLDQNKLRPEEITNSIFMIPNTEIVIRVISLDEEDHQLNLYYPQHRDVDTCGQCGRGDMV